MSRSKGFTLIELLVVIAIIALLMSILMPALAKVRNQAKMVIGQSNQRQWGILFETFASSNDGYFMHGWGSGGGAKDMWMEALRPYYHNKDLLCCPMANKPVADPAPNNTSTNTCATKAFEAWGILPGLYGWDVRGDYGSYAINWWVNNPTEDFSHTAVYPPVNCWRTPNVREAHKVPLFAECAWVHGAPIKGMMTPPRFEQATYLERNQLGRFVVNRHNGFINVLYLDSSVKKTGLKQLWTLKWHRTFDTANIWTIAYYGNREDCADFWDSYAPWMKNMKEY